MSLKWDDSLELGIDEIDNQHRALYEQYEKLTEATRQGKTKEIIMDLVYSLFDYTQEHFASEDRIMVEYKYPKTEVHQHEHELFTRKTLDLKKEIDHEGATREVAIKTSGNLVKWIIQHVSKHDRELIEFAKESIALRRKYETGKYEIGLVDRL